MFNSHEPRLRGAAKGRSRAPHASTKGGSRRHTAVAAGTARGATKGTAAWHARRTSWQRAAGSAWRRPPHRHRLQLFPYPPQALSGASAANAHPQRRARTAQAPQQPAQAGCSQRGAPPLCWVGGWCSASVGQKSRLCKYVNVPGAAQALNGLLTRTQSFARCGVSDLSSPRPLFQGSKRRTKPEIKEAPSLEGPRGIGGPGPEAGLRCPDRGIDAGNAGGGASPLPACLQAVPLVICLARMYLKSW